MLSIVMATVRVDFLVCIFSLPHVVCLASSSFWLSELLKGCGNQIFKKIEKDYITCTRSATSDWITLQIHTLLLYSSAMPSKQHLSTTLYELPSSSVKICYTMTVILIEEYLKILQRSGYTNISLIDPGECSSFDSLPVTNTTVVCEMDKSAVVPFVRFNCCRCHRVRSPRGSERWFCIYRCRVGRCWMSRNSSSELLHYQNE